MFAPEAQPWIEPFALKEEVTVPGLSPDYPEFLTLPLYEAME